MEIDLENKGRKVDIDQILDPEKQKKDCQKQG